MKAMIWRAGLIWSILVWVVAGVIAQEESTVNTEPAIPIAHQLQGIRYEPQGWNNCGPATITNALTFFGYLDNQQRAAHWLKPDYEDKNVSPNQMVEFVNTQVPELPVYALNRSGGTPQLMKVLLANNFPVIIEEGYDPEPDRLGWMGHYLLLSGYDENAGVFITHDSYLGAGLSYSYEHIEEFWQHFNYTYIVLYTEERREELETLLGSDMDEMQNAANAFAISQQEAMADQTDAHAWFNMGTNLLQLGKLYSAQGNEDIALELYTNATIAYDQARNIGLPWRMLWYQFGPFEAYYAVGRYEDMIALARNNLNDGGGHQIEETFYYGGLARQGLGEYDRALNNYQSAIAFNANFTPAIEARDALQAQLASNR